MSRLRFYLRARKFRRKWNAGEIDDMVAHLKSGDVALDIGSHKGGWLYWMQKSVGAAGTVHAFEPQRALHGYLSKMVRSYGWSHVWVHHLGLAREAGRASLFVPGAAGVTSPNATFSKGVLADENLTHTEEVDLVTLDEFGHKERWQRLDFIKIDVEGLELEVLEGAREVLGRLRPRIILECERRHLGMTGHELSEVFDLLAELGYAGSFFDDGKLAAIEEFDGDLHQSEVGDRFWDRAGYCNNFLFEPLA